MTFPSNSVPEDRRAKTGPSIEDRNRERQDRFVLVLGALCVFLLILVLVLLARVSTLSTHVDNLTDTISTARTEIHIADADAKSAHAQAVDNARLSLENRQVLCDLYYQFHKPSEKPVPTACTDYVAGLSGNGG